MLSIIHTEASTAWGGQEIRVVQESIGMTKKGYRVTIVAPEHSSIFKKAKEFGIPPIPFSFDKKNPSSFIRMASLINKEKSDIVNTHSSSDSWVVSIAAKLSRVKPIIIRTRHVSTPISKSFMSKVLYTAFPDAIVTTGESIRETMINHLGFPAEKIRSIPTGVDTTRFDPARAKPNMAQRGFLIGAIGVLRNWKGHHYLLDAAPLISAAIPDAFFYIVGDGPQLGNLKRKAEAMNILDRVSFLGHRDDIPEIIASLDIIAHPSYENEGVPQTILQAMAMKKPVVASDAGSIKEIVINNKTGFLIDPKNAGLIAEKVIELFRNPSLKKEFGDAGRDLIEKEYSLDRMISKMEALYESLLEKRGKNS